MSEKPAEMASKLQLRRNKHLQYFKKNSCVTKIISEKAAEMASKQQKF